EGLDFDRVTLFALSEDSRSFSLAHEWCQTGIAALERSPSGLCIDEVGWPLLELREGRSMVFAPDEVPEHATVARRVLLLDGTKPVVTVPLIAAGQVVGCMCFYQTRSDARPTEQRLRRLRLVGEMAASAMLRETAEASLKRSETHFAQVVASSLDAFIMVN